MGLGVKACVYGCIVLVVFFSVAFTIDLLDLRRWVPFATSTCLVVCMLLCFRAFAPPPSPHGGHVRGGMQSLRPDA
jgi:hypothetical protein